jgi:succinyl-CoA synthetase beta subunit
VGAAAAAVLAVARLVEERAQDVAELEINPLVVLEHGAYAVDALCRTAAVSGPPGAG